MPFNPEILPLFARIIYRRVRTKLDHRSWIVILYCGFVDPIIRSLLKDGWRPWSEVGDNIFKFTLPWCGYSRGDLNLNDAQLLWPKLMDQWVRVTLRSGIFEVFNTMNHSGLGIRATQQCLYNQMVRSLDGHLDIITEDEENVAHTFGRLREVDHNSLYVSVDEGGFEINGILWGPLSLVNSDVNFFNYRTQFVNQDRRGLDLRWMCWYYFGFEHFWEGDMRISSMTHSYMSTMFIDHTFNICVNEFRSMRSSTRCNRFFEESLSRTVSPHIVYDRLPMRIRPSVTAER